MKDLSELSINELRELFKQTRDKVYSSTVNSSEFNIASFELSKVRTELALRVSHIKSFKYNPRSAYGGYVGSYELEKPSIISRIKTFFKNLAF
jgi:hypothetical protein